jgi:hypothetical protein
VRLHRPVCASLAREYLTVLRWSLSGAEALTCQTVTAAHAPAEGVPYNRRSFCVQRPPLGSCVRHSGVRDFFGERVREMRHAGKT